MGRRRSWTGTTTLISPSASWIRSFISFQKIRPKKKNLTQLTKQRWVVTPRELVCGGVGWEEPLGADGWRGIPWNADGRPIGILIPNPHRDYIAICLGAEVLLKVFFASFKNFFFFDGLVFGSCNF